MLLSSSLSVQTACFFAAVVPCLVVLNCVLPCFCRRFSSSCGLAVLHHYRMNAALWRPMQEQQLLAALQHNPKTVFEKLLLLSARLSGEVSPPAAEGKYRNLSPDNCRVHRQFEQTGLGEVRRSSNFLFQHSLLN